MLGTRSRIAVVIFGLLVVATVGFAVFVAACTKSEGKVLDINVIQGDPSLLDDFEVTLRYVVSTDMNEKRMGTEQGGYRLGYTVDFSEGAATVTTTYEKNLATWGNYEGDVELVRVGLAAPERERSGLYYYSGDEISLGLSVRDGFKEEAYDVTGLRLFRQEDTFLYIDEREAEKPFRYYNLSDETTISINVYTLGDKRVIYGSDCELLLRYRMEEMADDGSYAEGRTESALGIYLATGNETYKEALENFDLSDKSVIVPGGIYVLEGSEAKYVASLGADTFGFTMLQEALCEEAGALAVIGHENENIVAYVYYVEMDELQKVVLWENVSKEQIVESKSCSDDSKFLFYFSLENEENRMIAVDVMNSPKVLWTAEMPKLGGEMVKHLPYDSVGTEEEHSMFSWTMFCRDNRFYVCYGDYDYDAHRIHVFVVEDGAILFQGNVAVYSDRMVTGRSDIGGAPIKDFSIGHDQMPFYFFEGVSVVPKE